MNSWNVFEPTASILKRNVSERVGLLGTISFNEEIFTEKKPCPTSCLSPYRLLRICLYHLSRFSVRYRSSLDLCGSMIIGIISVATGVPDSFNGVIPAASCIMSGRITRDPVPPTKKRKSLTFCMMIIFICYMSLFTPVSGCVCSLCSTISLKTMQ